jgi:CDP-diglyceride synthetase
MDERHVRVLLVYGTLMVLAAALTLVRQQLQPATRGTGAEQKHRSYIALNLLMLAAAWLPLAWHALAITLAAIGAAAGWEIGRALGLGRPWRVGLPALVVALVAVAESLTLAAALSTWLGVLLGGVVFSSLVGGREQLGRRLIGFAGAGVYLPVCLGALLWIWHQDGGGFRVVFFYLLIVSSEAFAQVLGQLAGGPLLAPTISQGKTIFGAIGGVLASAVTGLALCGTVSWEWWSGAAVGTAIGGAGVVGDLVESGWKRAIGIKDFSTLLGPQGGVLDRFDALLFAAPAFALLSVHLA